LSKKKITQTKQANNYLPNKQTKVKKLIFQSVKPPENSFISKLPNNNSSECLQASTYTPPLAQTICQKTTYLSIAKSKTKPNLNTQKKLRRIDSH